MMAKRHAEHAFITRAAPELILKGMEWSSWAPAVMPAGIPMKSAIVILLYEDILRRCALCPLYHMPAILRHGLLFIRSGQASKAGLR